MGRDRGMPRARWRRPAAVAATALGALVAAGAWAGAGGAGAPLSFSAVNGTANAGADRVEAGSDAFPNFRNGAFNDYYPMAHARVDGSPSSEATASPADTGPFGQSFASGTFGTPPFRQPQYAHALYPPGTTTPVTFGSPGSPYASATAAQTSASALAEYASSGPSGSAAAGASLAALDHALTRWRAQWLTAAAAARYPLVHPRAATPDGVSNGSARSTASIDPSQGLVLVAHALAQSASFGGGAIAVGNVEVTVSAVNAGTPAHRISVRVGSASIGGVPVTIGEGGVSVNGSEVPGLGMAIDQANAALNAALAQSGYRVTTVAPHIVKSPNQETIDATGVEVDYTQPEVAPGVPRQQVVHQVGEVFVDSLAAPGTPPAGGTAPVTLPGAVPAPPAAPAALQLPGTPGTPAVPATPGTPGIPASAPAPAATSGPVRTAAPALVAVRRSKPIDLVLLYFMWQSLVIGTVAALWWRRLGTAGRNP